MTPTILHHSKTPVDTNFQVRTANGGNGTEIIVFEGDDQTSQMAFEDQVLASADQAVQAAVAILQRYRPEALDPMVRVHGLPALETA